MFAFTVPRLRISRAAPLPLALLATLAIAGSTLAGSWTTPATLASGSHGPTVADLSAAGPNVVAAWTQEDPTTTAGSSVWVRESVNSGTTWKSAVRLAANTSMWADEVAVTSNASSGQHFAVWTESLSDNHIRVYMSKKAFGVGSWSTPVQVSTNTGSTDTWSPDIAVTSAYIFVTYTQTVFVDGDEINPTGHLRIYNLSTGIWTSSSGPAYLWTANTNSLAATSSRVATVWSNSSGVIRLRRGVIGPAPTHVITWSNSSLGAGEDPMLALSGNFGVIVSYKSGNIYVRRTANGGATWTNAQKVLTGSSPYFYRLFDVAMSGKNVVFTGKYSRTYCCDGTEVGSSFRMTSADWGTTWTKTQSNPALENNRQVAYTTKPAGGAAVAEIWNTSKVLYHRHL